MTKVKLETTVDVADVFARSASKTILEVLERENNLSSHTRKIVLDALDNLRRNIVREIYGVKMYDSVEQEAQRRFELEELRNKVLERNAAVNHRVAELQMAGWKKEKAEKAIQIERERVVAQEIWNAGAAERARVRTIRNKETNKNLGIVGIVTIIIIFGIVFTCCVLPFILI